MKHYLVNNCQPKDDPAAHLTDRDPGISCLWRGDGGSPLTNLTSSEGTRAHVMSGDRDGDVDAGHVMRIVYSA